MRLSSDITYCNYIKIRNLDGVTFVVNNDMFEYVGWKVFDPANIFIVACHNNTQIHTVSRQFYLAVWARRTS